MKPTERKRILEVWQRDCLNLEDQTLELSRIFDTTDCALIRAIYTSIEHYTERVAELISAEDTALEWYAHECNFGRNPMKCKHEDGREILVKNLDTFIETIDWI
jgi:hypothetical protein